MYSINDFTTELEDIHYSPMYITELEKKIKVLEHKNSELVRYKIQCEKLVLELNHIKNLKETFEEKYNQATLKLLYMDDEDSISFRESEQVKNLNQKCSIFMHANQDLKKEIEDLKAQNEKLNEEIRLLNSKNTLKIAKKCEASTNTIDEPRVLIDKTQICNTKKDEKEDKSEYFIDMPAKCNSILMHKDMSEKCFSTYSVSPFGRTSATQFTMQDKKLSKRAGGRHSPKAFKSKSRYMPSFLRKSSVKKTCT